MTKTKQTFLIIIRSLLALAVIGFFVYMLTLPAWYSALYIAGVYILRDFFKRTAFSYIAIRDFILFVKHFITGGK